MGFWSESKKVTHERVKTQSLSQKKNQYSVKKKRFEVNYFTCIIFETPPSRKRFGLYKAKLPVLEIQTNNGKLCVYFTYFYALTFTRDCLVVRNILLPPTPQSRVSTIYSQQLYEGIPSKYTRLNGQCLCTRKDNKIMDLPHLDEYVIDL